MLKELDIIYCKKTFRPIHPHNCVFEKGKWYFIYKYVTYDCVDIMSLSQDPRSRHIFKIDLENKYVANEYLWDYFITKEQLRQQVRKEKLKKINNLDGRQISYM